MLHKSDYTKALFDLTNEFLPFKDIVGVYQFGSVRRPGLSDLDIMVAVSDEPKNKKLGIDIAKLGLEEKYAEFFMGGTVMFVPDSVLDEIHLLDDITLTTLYGRGIVKKDVPEEYIICRVMDWLPERIYRIKRLLGGNCKDNSTLYGILRSFGQTLKDMNRFGLDVSLLQEAEFIDLLRRFNPERAEKVLEEATDVGYTAMLRWSDFLISNGYYIPPKKIVEAYFSIPNGPAYRNFSTVLELALPVPDVWFTHWLKYAEEEGYISEHIALDTHYNSIDKGAVSTSIEKALKKRAGLINHMAKFLIDHKFERGLFKFGWYL